MTASHDTSKEIGQADQEQFDVIFTGEILEGKQRNRVCTALGKSLKTGPENINRLFSKAPVVIKKKCPKHTAITIQTAFAKAGAVCIITPDGTAKNNYRENVTVDEAISILRNSIIPENEHPSITITSIPVRQLFSRYLYTLFTSFFIIGLFTGPRKLFAFIADSITINGQKLFFQSSLALALPVCIIIAGSYFYQLIISFIVGSLYTLPVKAIVIFTGICFYPVIPGTGILLLINFLITGTTVNGFSIGRPLFQFTASSIVSYINDHFKDVYFYGILTLLSLVGASPVLTAVVLQKWYCSFHVSGKQYHVSIPWQPVMLGTFMNVLYLGFYLPKSTAAIHKHMHKNGIWTEQENQGNQNSVHKNNTSNTH